MRDLAVLFLHLLATVARLAGPGGARFRGGGIPTRQAPAADPQSVSETVDVVDGVSLYHMFNRAIGRQPALPRRIRVPTQPSKADVAAFQTLLGLSAGRTPTPYRRIQGGRDMIKLLEGRPIATSYGLLKQPDNQETARHSAVIRSVSFLSTHSRGPDFPK